MAFGVMLLDMFKLCRFGECRYIPIQISQPLMKRRIARADIANVAFEMLHVYWIEPHNGSVQTNICFSNGLSKVKGGGMLF